MTTEGLWPVVELAVKLPDGGAKVVLIYQPDWLAQKATVLRIIEAEIDAAMAAEVGEWEAARKAAPIGPLPG